jgi:GNAT superfamily N-acetyltransferase
MPNNKKISIRQVESDEMLETLFWLDNYAFRSTPPFPDRSDWESTVRTRRKTKYYAVFEDGKSVAIAACPPLTQNIRGSIYKMGGIAAVSTHPEARRKGYSRRLIQHIFKVLTNKGNVLSSLYPFQETFYERLGYVTFPQSRKAVFPPSSMLPILNQDFTGNVSLKLFGEGYDDYHFYTEQMQKTTHGMAKFTDYEGEKKAAQKPRSWLAIAKSGGELIGLLHYSLKGDEIMNFNLRAHRFYYRTSEGKYLLLSWLARHVGQAGKVELWLPAFEQPNTWYMDIRPQLEPVFVAPMGRILNVKKIGGMEVNHGKFTAKIFDKQCPWNNGVWCFDGSSGLLEVFPGQKEDFVLSIQGLSALVYGVNDPGDFPYRGWGTPTIEFQSILRDMFPSKLPYLHEYY